MESLSKFWWIVAAPLVLAASMLWGNRYFAGVEFNRAIEPIDSAEQISAGILGQYPDSTRSVKILKMQYAIFGYRKMHHLELMRVFYTNFYAFSIILIVFSTLTTLTVFLLAKKGWDGTSPPIRLSLITCAFIASVFYLFSNVMDNKANIRNNLNGYISASRQQLQILQDINTLIPAGNGKTSRAADSIAANNYNFLLNNLQYFFNIDDSKIASNPLQQLGVKEEGKK